MDVLGLFVLVFFRSFVFNVIPGAWSPGVSTKQSISVSSGITGSAPCVSPISHVFDVSAYCIGSAVAVLCWSFPSPSLQMQALSCPALYHRVHYLVQFFAQHKDSRRFGFMCRYCHMLWFASGVHSCGLRLSRA